MTKHNATEANSINRLSGIFPGQTVHGKRSLNMDLPERLRLGKAGGRRGRRGGTHAWARADFFSSTAAVGGPEFMQRSGGLRITLKKHRVLFMIVVLLFSPWTNSLLTRPLCCFILLLLCANEKLRILHQFYAQVKPA
jgi:hypothetical protein